MDSEELSDRQRIAVLEETTIPRTEVTRRLKWMWRCIAGLVLVTFLSFAANGVLLDRQGEQADENSRLGKAIQDQRAESIRSACAKTNNRNRAAVRFLKGLPVSGRERPQLSKEERAILLQGFADALVGPRENCAKRVRTALDKDRAKRR